MPSQTCPLALLLPPVPFQIVAPIGATISPYWLLLPAVLLLVATLALLACLALWKKQLAQRRIELDALGEIAELSLRAQSEMTVLQEALHLFARSAHCLQACIYLIQDKPDLAVVLRYPWPGKPCESYFSSELLHNVVESQRVQTITPPPGSPARQFVGIPLCTSGRILGVLCAALPSGRFFLGPQEAWLRIFGNSLGIAIENTRLYLAAQQDLSRLVAVQELHRGISSTLDPGRLEELVLEKICGYLDVEAADLYLTNSATGELALSARQWPAEWGNAEVAHVQRQELAERTRNGGRVLLCPDLQARAESAAWPLASYVGVPLLIQEQWIGVLSLYSLRHLEYDAEEINFLSTVGGLAAVAIDNARLVQAARASESEAKRQALFRQHIMDSLVEGVLVFGHDGRISEANRSLCEMTGYSRQELLGKGLSLPFCPYEEAMRCRDLIINCQSGASAGPIELILQHRQGRRFPVQATMAPFVLDRQGVSGCVVSLHDISPDKQKLTELAQTTKMASIGRLAAGVAHELNNPLTAILGNTQFIRDLSHDQAISAQLKVIESQAQRAVRIVRGLLSFARSHPQERRPTDLNDTIRETLELISYQLRSKNISLVQELEPALPWIEADPGQLQQVILNLLVNAQQAIKGQRGSGVITVATASNRNAIRFSCTDDGPGVAPQIQGDLFKPFVTTKNDGEGTGLGLSICYQIIAKHNGRIWAETEPGKGSTFFFELPLPGAAQ